MDRPALAERPRPVRHGYRVSRLPASCRAALHSRTAGGSGIGSCDRKAGVREGAEVRLHLGASVGDIFSFQQLPALTLSFHRQFSLSSGFQALPAILAHLTA